MSIEQGRRTGIGDLFADPLSAGQAHDRPEVRCGLSGIAEFEGLPVFRTVISYNVKAEPNPLP